MMMRAVVVAAVLGGARARLLGHWTFDSDNSEKSKESTLALNERDYSATCGVQDTGVDGRFGDAIFFNDHCYAELPSPWFFKNIIGNNARSICAWVAIDGARGDTFHGGAVFSYGDELDDPGMFCLKTKKEEARWSVKFGDANRLRHFYDAPSSDAWHHLCLTYDAANVWTLYYDAAAVMTGAEVLDTSAGDPLQLGKFSETYRMKGAIDELWVFDDALTAAEVARLYDAGDAVAATAAPTPDLDEFDASVEPTTEPTAEPTAAPPDDVCADDANWYTKSASKSCDWVAAKPKRCKLKVKDASGLSSFVGCPSTCNACAFSCGGDDTDFYFRNENKNCAWVGIKADKRCRKKKKIGDIKYTASLMCPTACADYADGLCPA